MPALHVVRAAELPPHVFRGSTPQRSLMRPVFERRSIVHADGGLWTSSLNEQGTTVLSDYTMLERRHGDGLLDDWLIMPRPDARVVVVDTPVDYEALLARYGYTVGEPHFPVQRVHWEQLARDYDALRITRENITHCQDTYRAALITFWIESTVWFRWVFTDVRLVNDFGRLPARPLRDEPVRSYGADAKDAWRYGVPLPDDFRPELTSSLLYVDGSVYSETFGLPLALSRLAHFFSGAMCCWPETNHPERMPQLARERVRAIVEIHERKAIGMLITRWAQLIDVDPRPACVIHALVLVAPEVGSWAERVARLGQAATRANGLSPEEELRMWPTPARGIGTYVCPWPWGESPG